MSAGWLAYALVTGALLALAASALEGVARARRWPTRWIWATSMLATLAVVLRAAFARVDTAAIDVLARTASAGSMVGLAAASPFVSMLRDARALTESALFAAVAITAQWVPAWVGAAAGALWIGCAVAALGTLTLVHLRMRRARRTWPAAELHGRRVRVAPTVGPAVVGIVRPEIVVPRWLLERGAAEQRLVIAHEDEHVRTRDHLLLGGACVAVALMPWHPAAWWSLARLRLAIELDCDARVLQGGVPARRYGEMLIDLAGQCSGFRVGATALADKTSHLERRLLAMRPITKRYAVLRATTLCVAAALSLAAACEARVPTSSEVQSMDATSAKLLAEKTGMFDAMHGAHPTFYVNGVKVSAAEAHSIAPNDIATVDVRKADGAEGSSTIRIVTVAEGAGGKYRTGNPDAAEPGSETLQSTKRMHETTPVSEHAFSGIILIDGVRADASALHRLDPKDIAGIEVIKGAAASEMMNEPAAKNGIIKVTTQKTRG